MEKLVVEQNNIRIDKYLSEKLNISRASVQKLIDNEKIKVNDKFIKSSHSLNENDIISYTLKLDICTDILPENIKLDIIYEDEYLLVVNKPNNMIVHPANNVYSNTLVNALMYHSNLSNNGYRPGIVHRIDKKTTGLLLVAKNDIVHEKLSKMIKEKQVIRKYLVLVKGSINHELGTIDAPIGRDIIDRKKMSVTSLNSKKAITHFKVLKRFDNATLVECKLDTGRTHQIRVHFKYINHPIINDNVYNNKVLNDFGQMLHSKFISFNHPITDKFLEFEVDAPKEFYDILKLYEEV